MVTTVNGKPPFQLVPFEESDDLIDQMIEQHPGLRNLLEARRHEPGLSVVTAQHRLVNHRAKRTKKAQA